MAVRVAGDLYYDLDGQLLEIKRQLRQLSGYPFDPERLKNALQAVIEGRFDGAMTLTDSFRDLLPEGWEVLKNDEGDPVSIADLEIVSFLKEGESYVSGEEMCRRAREMGAAHGLRQGRRFLKEQDKVSREWRPYYLPLAGALVRVPYGYLCVPALRWSGVRWQLGFLRLEVDWASRDRLLRRK